MFCQCECDHLLYDVIKILPRGLFMLSVVCVLPCKPVPAAGSDS